MGPLCSRWEHHCTTVPEMVYLTYKEVVHLPAPPKRCFLMGFMLLWFYCTLNISPKSIQLLGCHQKTHEKQLLRGFSARHLGGLALDRPKWTGVHLLRRYHWNHRRESSGVVGLLAICALVSSWGFAFLLETSQHF